METISRPGRGEGFFFFSFPKRPPNLLLVGYRGSFTEVKWLGCQVDHTPPSSGRFRNGQWFTANHSVCLCGVDRDNLTFFMWK